MTTILMKSPINGEIKIARVTKELYIGFNYWNWDGSHGHSPNDGSIIAKIDDKFFDDCIEAALAGDYKKAEAIERSVFEDHAAEALFVKWHGCNYCGFSKDMIMRIKAEAESLGMVWDKSLNCDDEYKKTITLVKGNDTLIIGKWEDIDKGWRSYVQRGTLKKEEAPTTVDWLF